MIIFLFIFVRLSVKQPFCALNRLYKNLWFHESARGLLTAEENLVVVWNVYGYCDNQVGKSKKGKQITPSFCLKLPRFS